MKWPPVKFPGTLRRNFQWLIIVFSDAVKPLIKVSNQLVAAPANSDVVLHCYVESWPKALNTWYRDDGEHCNIESRALSLNVLFDVTWPRSCNSNSNSNSLRIWRPIAGTKLLPDEKHDLAELPLNDYAYRLKLTISRLNRDDFGSYTCSAENLLGKTEGTIRQQGNDFTTFDSCYRLYGYIDLYS